MSHSANSSGCRAGVDHDREIPEIDLLSPLQIRNTIFRNRIAMSPMCQYSAEDGFSTDWHLVHLGSRAAGGCALIMVEATAVAEDGRISLGDLGIWKNEHVEGLKRIAEFIKSQGAVPGIQLAHAGRKASCDLPWKGGAVLKSHEQGAWQTVAPSPVAFYENDPLPKEMNLSDIENFFVLFESAVTRALEAGFQLIEIHAAHGYLLHEFLSPITNQRTDEYGGCLENRMKLLLQLATRVRAMIPEEMPLFVRISATDWVENGWDVHQSIILATRLRQIGVDLIDVSSGGTVPKANIPVGRGYQVPLSKAIKEQAGIKTGAVGLITEVEQANEIITGGEADLIFLGRELLREPYWVHKAEQMLGKEASWPLQYGYAVKRRAG